MSLLHCKIKQWTNHYWTFQSSPEQKNTWEYIMFNVSWVSAIVSWFIILVPFKLVAKNGSQEHRKKNNSSLSAVCSVINYDPYMPSCAVFCWWYVCLHTTKSNHATNKYIYPIFCIWIPIWKDIFYSESLWEYTKIRQTSNKSTGFFTSLPNRKRPEVLLWLSLMGSFQIVESWLKRECTPWYGCFQK